jgi:hypothetical protein
VRHSIKRAKAALPAQIREASEEWQGETEKRLLLIPWFQIAYRELAPNRLGFRVKNHCSAKGLQPARTTHTIPSRGKTVTAKKLSLNGLGDDYQN